MLATTDNRQGQRREAQRRNETDDPGEQTARAQAGAEILRRMLEFFHGAEVSHEIMNATTLQDLLMAIEVHGLSVAPDTLRPRPDDIVTMTELAARLKLAMRTMERWHRKKVVRGIRVDDVVLFYWPAVVWRLLKNYQEPDGEEGKTQKPEVRSAAAQPVIKAAPKLPSAVAGTPLQKPASTPHPSPMASQARHKMDAPSRGIASRNVVPVRGGEGGARGRRSR